MTKTDKTYIYRYLARIILEAESPLAVGSGEKNIETDALVARDVNGLPYIPGTAIAGILRHAFGDRPDAESIFGYVNEDKGAGSQIFFTEARIIGSDGQIVDGLRTNISGDYYSRFINLPIRQHTRIGHRGVTITGGKFDEQIVYKGTRFCFEMEMISDSTTREHDFEAIDKLLTILSYNSIGFGCGTRSGLGFMKVVSCKIKKLDLSRSCDLDFYLKKTSCLTNEWGEEIAVNGMNNNQWVTYGLSLIPDDFFLFGSGLGDDDADTTQMKESMIVWQDGIPNFIDDCILIPATSIKGAVSHRTAYHYNKLTKYFADQNPPTDYDDHIGGHNNAVKILFGSEGNTQKGIDISRGNVLFRDIIEQREFDEKIFNHIAIDRFTGGVIGGALFSEKATYLKDKAIPLVTTIYVDKTAYDNQTIIQAFENALIDLCNGLLPLGRGVNRGQGTFTGMLTRDSELM